MTYFELEKISPEHIDFQGILDGLYYPFYMEKVRHNFMREKHGIDIIKEAEEGRNFVLVSYELKFIRSLLANQPVKITCEIKPLSKIKFGFYQEMIADDKVCAKADFIVTCVPSSGGRPCLPENVTNLFI